MAGCGIRPSGGGSGPRGQRRRTADPTGRLPPGIWFQVWPAAIRPQTPAVPEAKGPPGFRRHRDAHAGAEAQTRHAAAAEDHPRGLVPGTRRINTPDPGRGSIRQGRLPLQTGSRSHAPAVVGAEERLASHLYTYPPTIVGRMPPVQSFRAQNTIRIRIRNYGACMEVVRARHFAHSKWACFYAQNSSWAGLEKFWPAVRGRQLASLAPRRPVGPPRLCPTFLLFNVHDKYLPGAAFPKFLYGENPA